MSSRSNLPIKNRIFTILLFCLLTFTGCAAAVESPAVTGAPQTEQQTEAATEAWTEALVSPQATEAETEARVLLARPFAYQVDITHDERPELLVVDEYVKEDVAGLAVSLTKGDSVVWSDNLELTAGAARKAYFLCSVGADDYLVLYRTYFAEGTYRYIGEVFYITDEGEITPVDNEMLYVRTDSFEHYPLDSEGITKFSNWINWYLSRSTLLCGNENGVYTYSMTDAQQQYTEEFTELFSLVEDYTGCTTITEKVERINEHLYRQWFGETDPEGTKLTVPEEFYEAAERILEASRANIWMGEQVLADREIWFWEYDNRNLHLIRSDEPITTPLACNDILYYRAGSDESPEDVAKYMFERLVAEMTVPSENRPFVITDYRILNQKLYDAESSLEECWQSYRWEKLTKELTVQDHLWSWLGYAGEEYGFIPVTEDMWYFVPNGIFSFDGQCAEGKTMEDLTADPSLVVGGKISFVMEEDPKAVQYVLIRQGSVYRLQRAEAMEALYPELIKNYTASE